jgi:hypothetical protein
VNSFKLVQLSGTHSSRNQSQCFNPGRNRYNHESIVGYISFAVEAPVSSAAEELQPRGRHIVMTASLIAVANSRIIVHRQAWTHLEFCRIIDGDGLVTDVVESARRSLLDLFPLFAYYFRRNFDWHSVII